MPLARSGRSARPARPALGFEFHLIYQKLHQFCVVEMGSFYLDILKDRMYTMRADSRGRRSAQTAMYHILEALVRWLAPILSFTAEEIWSHMPAGRGESVFLAGKYDLSSVQYSAEEEKEGMSLQCWDTVIAVRETVKRELEKLRVAGGIGSSLDAEVDIYGEPRLFEVLQKLHDELRFVFIASYVRVHPVESRRPESVETEIKGLYVQVAPSAHPKCIRCWHHRADVGAHQDHPEICTRCVLNVSGAGETRSYA